MKTKPKSTAVEIELRIALRYALFGGLWILLSDRLLEAFVTDTATLSTMQTYKGWVFVALSALLIYSLLRRELTLRKAAEIDLRESEAQLKEAQRLAHIGSAHWDAATNVSTWSDELRRIMGWDSPLPSPSQEEREKLFTPESFLLLANAVQQTLATGEPFDVELEIVRPDGVRRRARGRGSVTRDENGTITGLNNTLEDITERKQAEEGLRRYELLSVHSRDIILFVNRHGGQILEANAAAEQAYGYSRDEFRALNIRDLRVPEEQNLTATQMEQADVNGILFETIHVRKDGSQFPVEVSSQGANIGGVRTLTSIIRDITERRQAEEELRESEQRFRTLMEQSSEGVVLIGEDGSILEWNQAMEDISGILRAQALGKPVWDIQFQTMPSELRSAQSLAAIEKQFTHILRTGNLPFNKHIDVSIQTSREETKVITQTIFAIKTARGYRVGSIVLDITERKRAEDELRILNERLEQRVAERTIELEHANHAKDEFLATMSHELRTPLNSILGLSEMLLEERRGSLNAHQQRSLQMIETSGQHLLELINDILDLSKIEAGKLDYIPQPLSVDDVCRSSLMFVNSLAAKKSITITYRNQSAVARITADARRLKQILVNLLSNAVKFTPEHGHVDLEVKTQIDQDRIQFSVIDDGAGIAAEDLQKLFQPFVQLDSSLSRLHEGTGLGLALVQKLTDLHGGSVDVESEVGKGSCFTINLNCRQDTITDRGRLNLVPGSDAVLPPNAVGISSSVPVARGAILLAEDNLPNILTIGEYLESHGYQVIVARDGLETIAKAEESNPELILMDIQMPVMNGLDAIARLRANPRFLSVPIIALTALVMPGDRERCLQMGASEYMSKPVSLKILVRTINSMLNP